MTNSSKSPLIPVILLHILTSWYFPSAAYWLLHCFVLIWVVSYVSSPNTAHCRVATVLFQSPSKKPTAAPSKAPFNCMGQEFRQAHNSGSFYLILLVWSVETSNIASVWLYSVMGVQEGLSHGWGLVPSTGVPHFSCTWSLSKCFLIHEGLPTHSLCITIVSKICYVAWCLVQQAR